MPGTIPAARQHLIDAIAKHARKLEAPQGPITLPEFVQPYYRGVGEEDLQFREPAQFAAAAARHLEFGLVRPAGQPLVHDDAADSLDAEIGLQVRQKQRLVGDLLDDARFARRHLADDLGEHRLRLVGDGRDMKARIPIGQ